MVLYVRHYSNAIQMLPKLLLIVIGLPILLEQDLKLGDSCKEVLTINGRPFLPMSAWLLTQIVTDIAILITRCRRYFLMAPVVRAFDRGEGVEARAAKGCRTVEARSRGSLRISPQSLSRCAHTLTSGCSSLLKVSPRVDACFVRPL